MDSPLRPSLREPRAMKYLRTHARRSFVLLALLLATDAGAQGTAPSHAAPTPAPADTKLPLAVRPGTRAAMSRHAELASALTVSVALGTHAEIERFTTELLTEPRPARPAGDDLSTFNQQLPAKLFTLDDDFRGALRKLQAAARARDDERTLTHHSAVIRACRACHSALRDSTPRR